MPAPTNATPQKYIPWLVAYAYRIGWANNALGEPPRGSTPEQTAWILREQDRLLLLGRRYEDEIADPNERGLWAATYDIQSSFMPVSFPALPDIATLGTKSDSATLAALNAQVQKLSRDEVIEKLKYLSHGSRIVNIVIDSRA